MGRGKDVQMPQQTESKIECVAMLYMTLKASLKFKHNTKKSQESGSKVVCVRGLKQWARQAILTEFIPSTFS